jgi:adenine phosphoribosyltransferase
MKRMISDAIRGIPDFPKPGILFWDITTLLLNPDAFQATVNLFVERYKDQRIDVIAGRFNNVVRPAGDQG